MFLDVDRTLLRIDLDVEGYVNDLAGYARNGPLSVDRARRPVWESLLHPGEHRAPHLGGLPAFVRD